MPASADFPRIGTHRRHVVCHARRQRVHWLSDPLKRVGGDVVDGGLPRSVYDERTERSFPGTLVMMCWCGRRWCCSGIVVEVYPWGSVANGCLVYCLCTGQIPRLSVTQGDRWLQIHWLQRIQQNLELILPTTRTVRSGFSVA